MSFVGIIKCKDGVLAFGDKRSPLNEELDVKRGNIQKIFFKENVIPICKTIDNTKLYIGISPEFDFVYKEKDKKPIKLSI